MKVMLSNTPLGKTQRMGLRTDERTLRPSTGILYLASMLGKQRRLGLSRIADVMLEEPNVTGSAARIGRYGPDIFGVTAYEFNLDEVKGLIADVKGQSPDTLCFVGGPAATKVPRYVMSFTGADAVFRGEADMTFRNVVAHIKNGGKLKDVRERGVSVRDGKSIIETSGSGERPHISMNTFEMIDPDIGLIHDLQSLASYEGIDFSFSRGCPSPTCSFCQISTVPGHRRLSDEKAISILKEISGIPGVRVLVFGDGTFGGGNGGARRLLRMIQDEGLAFPYGMYAELSVEMLLQKGELGQRSPDPELLSLMKETGLRHFEIGIESLSEDQLRKFNKLRFTFDEVCGIFDAIESVGLNGFGPIHLMGIDTVSEEVVDTITKAFMLQARFGPDILSVCDTVIPFVGTGEYQKFMRYMREDPSGATRVRKMLEQVDGIVDISGYEFHAPYLLKYSLPVKDEHLLRSSLSLDPNMVDLVGMLPSNLLEEVGYDAFTMLLQLSKLEDALSGGNGDRERALLGRIENAFEMALRLPDSMFAVLAARNLVEECYLP
jgi:hypothetical protein